ncbi:hypothetical protein [Desulfogranum mediterraneum]|uniref:hypothetical protein n=1 Tax=Desulfogranum mediterraneum TaxID=160661 RepID=UPI00041A8BE0|nr:hypothetical protein [Desulfogranum mediterraneum]
MQHSSLKPFTNRLQAPRLLLLLLLSVCWQVTTVQAHNLHVFAYRDQGTIYTESYFSDGRAVRGGRIEVRQADDRLLLSGSTDEQGGFFFPEPTQEALTIVIDAGMGHRNQFTLKGDLQPDRR